VKLFWLACKAELDWEWSIVPSIQKGINLVFFKEDRTLMVCFDARVFGITVSMRGEKPPYFQLKL
jgi:hypothetical protein